MAGSCKAQVHIKIGTAALSESSMQNDHWFLHNFSFGREWCLVAGSGGHQKLTNKNLRRKRGLMRRSAGKQRKMLSNRNESGLHNFAVPCSSQKWCDVGFAVAEEWLGFLVWNELEDHSCDMILASLKGSVFH